MTPLAKKIWVLLDKTLGVVAPLLLIVDSIYSRNWSALVAWCIAVVFVYVASLYGRSFQCMKESVEEYEQLFKGYEGLAMDWKKSFLEQEKILEKYKQILASERELTKLSSDPSRPN